VVANMELHLAAASGDVVEMRRLVAAGVNVDVLDEHGATALHYAAVFGRLEAIRVLVVALGANNEAKCAVGKTPLHVVAQQGLVEAITVLVQLGANKEAKDVNGGTPLHQAVYHGHAEAVKLLVQLGANKDAKTAHGETPLHIASRTGHAKAIKALMQLGASYRVDDAEETMCVVCMDAPKNRVVLPCMHMCVCEACAQRLSDHCPVCRGPIERIAQLFT
jgi:ankyrin repeat protein